MGLSIAISSGTAQVVGAFRDERASCQRILDARVHRCVCFPVAFFVGMGDDPASASNEGRHGIAYGACGARPQGTFGRIQEFHAVLLMLFFANLFITVLQDLKEDFLVKIIDVKAAGLSSWAFAKIDATVTLVILILFAAMSMVKSNVKVLCLLLALVTCGCAVLSSVAFNYEAWNLPCHALAFPAEPVPLYRLFEFPDSFLRAFHRLFQDKRQRGFLHYHAGFHRLYGYGVGSGVQGMFQSRCQLIAIL